MKCILSLFDYWGSWGYPYHVNGYDVIQIDIQLGQDILQWDYKSECDNVYGILAAPPCDDFTRAGNRYWKQKDENGKTEQSLKLIYKTLEIVEYFNPKFWVIENPPGRLNSLVPQLKAFGPRYHQPFWYGDPYIKHTGLWGEFNNDLKRNEVYPYEGSQYITNIAEGPNRKNLRSRTPDGFANAFFEANR